MRGNKEYIIAALIYVTIFVSSYIYFSEPFEFYFGYLVYLLLLPVFIFRHPYNRYLSLIFIILLLVGLLNVFLGNNTFELFLKVFVGLSLSYLFYYYVLAEYNFDVKKLFRWYMVAAYIVALIGMVQFVSFQIGFGFGYNFGWIFNKWGVAAGGIFGIRVNSILPEPTHLAGVLAPAFFVAVYDLTRREPIYVSRFRSLVIMAVYFLSFSGLGQTGMFLTLVLFAVNFGVLRYSFLLVPIVVLLFNYLYDNVGDFRERFEGIVDLYSGEEFVLGKTHGSSFILYNNYIVATENFKNNYIFGGGIGSHPIAFKKYSRAKNYRLLGLDNNAADANSMLLRLISETGIFGTGIFLFVLFKCYIRRNPEYDTGHWLISNALLLLILLNLFRQGHYFLNGFPFFVLLYYYNYQAYINEAESNYNRLSKSIKG